MKHKRGSCVLGNSESDHTQSSHSFCSAGGGGAGGPPGLGPELLLCLPCGICVCAGFPFTSVWGNGEQSPPGTDVSTWGHLSVWSRARSRAGCHFPVTAAAVGIGHHGWGFPKLMHAGLVPGRARVRLALYQVLRGPWGLQE